MTKRLSYVAAERDLRLCSADVHESPRAEDLLIDGHVLPLPILTNFVLVATPQQPDNLPIELPLETIATRSGFDINNRRFAAVKISIGKPQSQWAFSTDGKNRCESYLVNTLQNSLENAGLRREVATVEPELEQAMREPMSTCLFFSSGNMVCTGSSNPYSAMYCVHLTATLIRKTKPEYCTPRCKVENIVASVQLFPSLNHTEPDKVNPHKRRRKSQDTGPIEQPKHVLPLTEIAKAFGLEANYEPDLFPGAIFRPNSNDDGQVVCFLVFPSGQCVITGAKKTTAVYSRFKWFYIQITRAILEIAPHASYIPSHMRRHVRAHA